MTAATAVVSSRLDYRNFLLYGVSKGNISSGTLTHGQRFKHSSYLDDLQSLVTSTEQNTIQNRTVCQQMSDDATTIPTVLTYRFWLPTKLLRSSAQITWRTEIQGSVCQSRVSHAAPEVSNSLPTSLVDKHIFF